MYTGTQFLASHTVVDQEYPVIFYIFILPDHIMDSQCFLYYRQQSDSLTRVESQVQKLQTNLYLENKSLKLYSSDPTPHTKVYINQGFSDKQIQGIYLYFNILLYIYSVYIYICFHRDPGKSVMQYQSMSGRPETEKSQWCINKFWF